MQYHGYAAGSHVEVIHLKVPKKPVYAFADLRETPQAHNEKVQEMLVTCGINHAECIEELHLKIHELEQKLAALEGKVGN